MYLEQYWTADELRELMDLWNASENGARPIFLKESLGPSSKRYIYRWGRFVSAPQVTVVKDGVFLVTYSIESCDPPTVQKEMK